jgi:hypothetical protein
MAEQAAEPSGHNPTTKNLWRLTVAALSTCVHRFWSPQIDRSIAANREVPIQWPLAGP